MTAADERYARLRDARDARRREIETAAGWHHDAGPLRGAHKPKRRKGITK
jgi:hypothetical protein